MMQRMQVTRPLFTFGRGVPTHRAFSAGSETADVLKNAASWAWRHFDNSAAAASPETPIPSSMPVQLEGHLRAKATVTRWPEYCATPMRRAPRSLTSLCGVEELWLKDECGRLGCGSFKAIGGGVAVTSAIDSAGSAASFATASAGNHGVGVAWACKTIGGGAPCHVFVHSGVGELMVDRIHSLGAIVHRVDGGYFDALAAARTASEGEGWTIVQDVSWDGYTDIPRQIFEGYTMIAEEMIEQWQEANAQPPTHVFVNAGIGGLSTGVCSHLWARLGRQRPRFIAVEPLASDCLLRAARDGEGHVVEVPHSAESTIQVGLDVKRGDPFTWPFLAAGVNDFVAIGDEVVQPWKDLLVSELSPPIAAGDSAVAGLGVLLAAAAQPRLRSVLGLTESSRVAVIVCEGVSA